MSASRTPPGVALDASTLPAASGRDPASSGGEVERTGLVVLWSRDEPARIGEILLFPKGASGPWTFGRGDARGGEERLSLVQQRPGVVLPTGPLTCPRIFRVQLRVTAARESGVLVENVGACPMLHRGHEVTHAEVAVGDTLALRNELLFLCVRRAGMESASVGDLAVPLHPFGRPDAFGLVGESSAMWALRRRILGVARQSMHVLVLGPSGSGKELVARAIHARSSRGHRSMVSRNAATIPEGLAASEFFGNIRNYPNPGMPERPGLVGQAQESTLFLDEFAELPRSIQAQLLRVMDDGEYQRLGEATTRRVDFRMVAATNRPEIELKEDVLARFELRIPIPNLNSRREDIPLLIVHLMRSHAVSDPMLATRFFPGGDPEGHPLLSPVLMEALVEQQYTTHVRELDALLMRAALEGRGRHLGINAEVRRELRLRAPTEPPKGLPSPFTAEEQSRLSLLRKHRFSPTACGRNPAYPGNRQTADLHLRHLVCKALENADWDTDRATTLLAGDEDSDLCDKSGVRIQTFLTNLSARLASESAPALREALVTEWKGSQDAVLRLLDALIANKLTGSRVPSP